MALKLFPSQGSVLFHGQGDWLLPGASLSMFKLQMHIVSPNSFDSPKGGVEKGKVIKKPCGGCGAASWELQT